MNASLLDRGVRAVRRAFPGARPVAGLILGSGWRAVADAFRPLGRLPYRRIPGLGRATVAGHDGTLLWGVLAGLETFVFLGRRHWYEGAGWEPVACPIAVLRRFGAGSVILTNAAGSLRPDVAPGALALVDDHINAMGTHPLVGRHDPAWGPRFPDQTAVYDPGLRRAVRSAARRARLPLRHGVYLAVSGPAYETPAEVRAYRAWGADIIGMSTVPEAVLARAAGLRVAAVAFIANRAAGGGRRPLEHAEIAAAAAAAAPAMTRLVRALWTGLAAERRP